MSTTPDIGKRKLRHLTKCSQNVTPFNEEIANRKLRETLSLQLLTCELRQTLQRNYDFHVEVLGGLVVYAVNRVNILDVYYLNDLLVKRC